MSLRSTKAVSFWFVAYALLMIMMGANIPAPLYSLYGEMRGSFYAVTYLGAGLPVLILGFGAERIGFLPAILIYSGLVVIAAIALAGIVHRYCTRGNYAAQDA